MKQQKICIIGSGVAGINAATKLVDNGYPGELITIIDKGRDPYKRKPEEVMTGYLGAGGWSDGKLTYHTSIGGQLSKYCGEEKAMELMDEVINNFKRFHPKPDEVQCSNPVEEPDFIKPYFGLRLFPVWHIGTDYLSEIAKNWYDYLVDKGVNFMWGTEVLDIDFEAKEIIIKHNKIKFDICIVGTGKAGIDFSGKLAQKYNLPIEQKSVQIGCRFEAPQKYFQKLIDVSYDFKLYQKFDNVSIRSFCTNNNAAFVAVEETYGDITYNGHAKKGEEFRNNMTNFGILMEIKGIENPFEWSRNLVNKLQIRPNDTGLYYSPNSTRTPSTTSEGTFINTAQIDEIGLRDVDKAFQGYFKHIVNFISQMDKIFEFGDDYGIYIPEVKYVSAEPLVNYSDLSLIDYPNIYFVGDSLSARGITVAGSHGIYCAEHILSKNLDIKSI